MNSIVKKIRKLVRRFKKWVWHSTLPIRSRIDHTFFVKLYYMQYREPYALLDGTVTEIDGIGSIKRHKPHCIDKMIEQKDVIIQRVCDDLRNHFNTTEHINDVGFFCGNLTLATGARTHTYELDREIFFNDDGTIKEIKDMFTNIPESITASEESDNHKMLMNVIENMVYD